jgi:1-acyl-sn-glycerol-3-phosphate acyltransferase
MRSLLALLTAIVVTLVLGPVVMIARLFRVPHGPHSIYAWSVRRWARAISRAAGVRVRLQNGERMYHDRGAVFIANHVSWFDIFALASEVPWCSFIAKSELRRIPLFGFAAECVGIVFLDRDNRKAAFESYKLAALEVQRGRAVIVCPEGTRGHDYHLRPFKKGPFVLAIASQCPVVPTIVYGAREIMPKGSFWIRPGVVEVHFLEPIATTGYDYEHRTELMAAVWSAMADALRADYGVYTSEHPVAEGA